MRNAFGFGLAGMLAASCCGACLGQRETVVVKPTEPAGHALYARVLLRLFD